MFIAMYYMTRQWQQLFRTKEFCITIRNTRQQCREYETVAKVPRYINYFTTGYGAKMEKRTFPPGQLSPRIFPPTLLGYGYS